MSIKVKIFRPEQKLIIPWMQSAANRYYYVHAQKKLDDPFRQAKETIKTDIKVGVFNKRPIIPVPLHRELRTDNNPHAFEQAHAILR